MGFTGALLGGLKGFDQAVGASGAAQDVQKVQDQKAQEKQQKVQMQLAPLHMASVALQSQLAPLIDPNTGKPRPESETRYNEIHDQLADVIGKQRMILNPPPKEDPHGLGHLVHAASDKLHITNHAVQQAREANAKKVNDYYQQGQDEVAQTVQGVVPGQLSSQEEQKAARIKAGIDPRAVTKPQARDSVQKAQWDAEARKLGYRGYDDPAMTGEDVEKIQASLRAPIRPSQAALATYLRAKYGDNPTAEQIEEGTRAHQALLAGVKIGEHQQLVFDDNGIPHVVNLHSESRTEFPAPVAPTSTASPTSTSPKPHAAAPKAPSGGGLGFTKGNPLVKSDSAQYTKVAEDANQKKEAYESAQKALAQGSTASSDQELIYSWVRSNVQGAGRMTQAEFRQAASTGSLPLRAQAAWEKLKTGKLPPELEKMLLADVKRSYDVSQKEADDLRQRLAPPAGPKTQQLQNMRGGGADPLGVLQ